MLKKLCPILIFILIFTVAISFAQEKKAKMIKIGVTQIVSHPALDGDAKGLLLGKQRSSH